MEEETLKKIAQSCEVSEPNLAIVLHVYLGSKYAGLDGIFAEYSQDFAKSSLKTVKELKLRRN
ncbi:hypothetical protein CL634_06485 [bacterium]|nr:hypothetical protein [bacterium]